MRWRFFDPKNRPESAERNEVLSRIDSWWREFQTKTDDIPALFKQKAKWDLPEWMEQHLQAIDPSLCWEFGPALQGNGHRLVITPESAHHLRPLTRVILERAPVLVGWEFYEYRLAEDLESTRLTVEGRSGFDISGLKFRASIGDQNRIDLKYTSPEIADPDDPSASGAAFVTTESLLGEQCLNNWIGLIEIAVMQNKKGIKSPFARESKEQPHFLGLDRLKETVNALIGSVRDQLPPSPHCEWVEGAEWTIWELKPDESDDYPEQQDLFVGKSANPKLWKAAHSGGLFCSERFSRTGETFCYVKLDGSEGLSEEGFADKSEIEDALDAVLKPDKIGCCFGGGTGRRYSYVDLALKDVNSGIQSTRRRLRAGKVPKRSWVLFFDSDLSAEWVGIYDDTPPPPMALDSA
jgi:hypothetical protein